MAKAPRKAAAKRPASKTAVKPAEFKGNAQRPEADGEAPPTFRADMGEGLPDQKDTLNPNRAK